MDIDCKVSGVAICCLALAMLVLPLQWFVAMILAASIHEACHYLMIQSCGGTITGFRVGLDGAHIQVYGLTTGKELLCALAGPIGGALLLLFADKLPRTAICAALQSLYNLLPIYPLDGGRALRCALHLVFPSSVAELTEKWIQWGAGVAVCLLGAYGTFILRLGIMPLVISCTLLLRGKRPCKPRSFSIQ